MTGSDEWKWQTCNLPDRLDGPRSGQRRWAEPTGPQEALQGRQGCCWATGLRFHDLRHSYGSNLAAAGVDLVAIQSVMGHGALAMTSRYLHARDAAEKAEVFTKVFQPATAEGVAATA